jgi:hypothetical protein
VNTIGVIFSMLEKDVREMAIAVLQIKAQEALSERFLLTPSGVLWAHELKYNHEHTTSGEFGVTESGGGGAGAAPAKPLSAFHQLKTDAERASYMEEHALAWERSIDRQEKAAILEYVDNGFVQMNETLRTGKGTKAIRAQIEDAATGISQGKGAPSDMTVHRAVGPGADAFWAKLQKNVGKTYREKAFSSTTTDAVSTFKGVNADGIDLKIEVPEKASGAYVSILANSHTNEHEFLLPPDTNFKVLSTSVDATGMRHAHLQVVRTKQDIAGDVDLSTVTAENWQSMYSRLMGQGRMDDAFKVIEHYTSTLGIPPA